MKKDQVQVGSVYSAKVSGGVVPVRITEEKWSGEKHTGWAGVNTLTNRPVRIKSAQRLRAPVPGPAGAEAAAAAVAGDAGPGGAAADEGVVTAKAGSPVPSKAGKAASGKKSATAKGGGKSKAKAEKTAAPAKSKLEQPLSGLDAAAKVLKDAGEPMRIGEVLEVILKKGLWSSKGKTPEATLYAAVIREIRDKGVDSRFVKNPRWLFAHA